MKLKQIFILLVVCICTLTVGSQNKIFAQTVTLLSPIANNHDFRHSFFDFEYGKHGTQKKWDLLYGNMQIGEDFDWLSASTATDNRSLIRDLGELNWNDKYEVPVIEPLPKLEEGKLRSITIDSSGDTGKAWAKSNGIFVKAVVGHLYVMHVKDSDSDFYVLFRVESIERVESCTISWKSTDAPEKISSDKARA